MKRRGQHPLLHAYALQTPAISVIGTDCYLVYCLLRKFCWKGVTHHNSRRVNQLRDRGKIVGWLDHDYAAALLGLSRESVGNHLRRLRQEFGWIRAHRISGNRRAYQIGYYKQNSKKAVIYADLRLQAALLHQKAHATASARALTADDLRDLRSVLSEVLVYAKNVERLHA